MATSPRKTSKTDAAEAQPNQEQPAESEQKESGVLGSEQQGGEEKTIPVDPLLLTVKSNALFAVFEPCSKTSISPAETVQIRCIHLLELRQVKLNLKQLTALGHELVIL